MNKPNLKFLFKKILPAMLLSGYFISPLSIQAKEFNDIVIFSDSLVYPGIPNDGYGDLRYIAGGGAFPSYADIASLKLTGKKTLFYQYGGLSYSHPGAHITNNPFFPEFQTDRNIDEYLKTHNYKADPNALYHIAIGGGDINIFIQTSVLELRLRDEKNKELLLDKLQVLKTKMLQLSDAGAKTFVVSNIPDASYSPLMLLFVADTINILFETFFNFKLTFLTEALGRRIDNELRPMSNVDTDPKNKELLKKYYFKSFNIQFPFLSHSFLEKMYDSLVGLTTSTTQNFNHALLSMLEEIGDSTNIVFLDFYKLADEVIENPQLYGIDNTVVPTCTMGLTSPKCTLENGFHADKKYFASDWFHPSPETHMILGNYFISTFNAPVFISSIAKLIEGSHIASNLIINSQLDQMRINPPASYSQWKPIVAYSLSYEGKNNSFYKDRASFKNFLNLGAITQYNSNVAFGGLFTTSIGKYKPYKNLNYNYGDFDLSLFGQYKQDAFGLNAALGLNYLKTGNINRTIDFGTGGKITEKGKTNGHGYHFDLLASYDFTLKDHLIISPIAGYSWGNYKVKNYEEESNRSTAMRFKDIKKDVSYFTLGVKFNSTDLPTNISAEVSYNLPTSKNPMKVEAGVKSSTIDFIRNSEPDNKNWLGLKLGANRPISENINLFSNLEYRDTKDKSNQYIFNLGIKGKF